MSTLGDILQYILPVLAVSIAVILLCFYHYAKKRRGSYDVTMPTVHEEGCPSSVQRSIDLPETVFFDSVPPRYSTVEPPPPYSLFDPKLIVWPGGAPPAYEMYPITLPLAPHH